MRHFVLELIGL